MQVRTDPSSVLLQRIAAAQILREHHVWEAARCLCADHEFPRSGDARFRELMQADALVDAVMHLADSRTGCCRLESIRRVGGRWNCVMRRLPAGGRNRAIVARGAHVDLAGALLEALVKLRPRPHAQAQAGTQAKKRGSS